MLMPPSASRESHTPTQVQDADTSYNGQSEWEGLTSNQEVLTSKEAISEATRQKTTKWWKKATSCLFSVLRQSLRCKDTPFTVLEEPQSEEWDRTFSTLSTSRKTSPEQKCVARGVPRKPPGEKSTSPISQTQPARSATEDCLGATQMSPELCDRRLTEQVGILEPLN